MLKTDVAVNYSRFGGVGAGSNEFDSIVGTRLGLKRSTGALWDPSTGRPRVSAGANVEYLFLPVINCDNIHIEKLPNFDYPDSGFYQKTWLLDESFNDLNIEAISGTSYHLEQGVYYIVIRIPESTGTTTLTLISCLAMSIICVPTPVPWVGTGWGITSPTMIPLSNLIDSGNFYCSTSKTSPVLGTRSVILFNQPNLDPKNIISTMYNEVV